MSFSKDVKEHLRELNNNSWECCKEAFSLGERGMIPVLKCKRCAIQYIAGTFCAFGTMSDPEYKFQLFIYPTEEALEHVHTILSECMNPNFGISKGKDCVYFKSSESVGDFLAYCKATPFAMRVYDAGIEKVEKTRVQRECNAEFANMARAAAAAGEQINAIKLLRKYNMIDGLKTELKKAALLREAYPEAGLSELCLLSSEPISKSGLNYRLKKLVSLAEDLKAEDEP